jgi:hypothetical protein
MLPTLYLLKQREQQQKAGSNSDSESSSSGSNDADSESDIAEAADESRSSRGGSRGGSRSGSSGSALAGTSSAGASHPDFWLSHTKPRKPRKSKQEGPAARIVLTLRLLSGYDQRHSLQVRQGGQGVIMLM